MKTTILLILVWLAVVSANLLRHESSVELNTLKGSERKIQIVKGRMLKKDSNDSDDSDDDDNNRRNSGDGDDDDDDKKEKKSSGDKNEDDPSETKAHRDGRVRGSSCRHIYIVDEDNECADDVEEAVKDVFESSTIHMDDDCDEADDNEDVCLEISDGDDCDEIVEDSLDELYEWCDTGKSGGGGGVEEETGTTVIDLTVETPEPPPFTPTLCGNSGETVRNFVHMQYSCDEIVKVSQGNTCILMHGEYGTSGTEKYPGGYTGTETYPSDSWATGWVTVDEETGKGQGSGVIRTPFDCGNIYLAGEDRCLCSGDIVRAVLEAFGDASVHMGDCVEGFACHDLSGDNLPDDDDCTLAQLKALLDIGWMCGTDGTTTENSGAFGQGTTTEEGGAFQGSQEHPTGYTDGTGSRRKS